MIVVTGTPRSGTSFVMNTLRKGGYPVVGEMFLPEFGPKEFNPNGFWELPVAEIWNGIHHNKYHGKAIKLLGLYASLSDLSNFEGLICCTRNRRDSIRSLFRLINSVGEFRGAMAWLIAEQSYDIHLEKAKEIFERFRGRKLSISIDDKSLNEKNIKEFVSWPMPQQ